MTRKVVISKIANKVKREQVYSSAKREKKQLKLKRRIAQAELEKNDPEAKKKRLAENVPKTQDNMREFDPSMLTANPNNEGHPNTAESIPNGSNVGENDTNHGGPDEETLEDISNDPFEHYFSQMDPTVPPKVLITTGPKSCKTTYDFCDELVGVFPGAEFIRRKKGKGFEMGRIAGWAAKRGYSNMIVVNEDMKKPNAITLIHLPNGPTAFFKLTSIELTKQIFGHARATPHYPELVLNGFVTRLGHGVGRMFQTLYPPLPEFEGRQVVTLHNQRDFLFFRRHRYAFRSTEKAALQEIGPRFTLKLRWMKKGLPLVRNFGAAPPPLQLASENPDEDDDEVDDAQQDGTQPPRTEEYIWQWKPELEVSRRTFFL